MNDEFRRVVDTIPGLVWTALPDGDVDFVITVREYVSPPDPAMRYVAQTDKQTNQKTAPYTPTGWGSTLEIALVECLKAIRLFRYER